jgi:hypothetical protein
MQIMLHWFEDGNTSKRLVLNESEPAHEAGPRQ